MDFDMRQSVQTSSHPPAFSSSMASQFINMSAACVLMMPVTAPGSAASKSEISIEEPIHQDTSAVSHPPHKNLKPNAWSRAETAVIKSRLSEQGKTKAFDILATFKTKNKCTNICVEYTDDGGVLLVFESASWTKVITYALPGSAHPAYLVAEFGDDDNFRSGIAHQPQAHALLADWLENESQTLPEQGDYLEWA